MTVVDETLRSIPSKDLNRDVMSTAYSLRLISESHLIETELRRMKDLVPLTVLEEATALRLGDELHLVRDDWWVESPGPLWALRDLLDSHDLLVIMLLLAADALDRSDGDDDYIWELESIFDALDMEGCFENDRFFAPGSRKHWEGRESIRAAILREAVALSDREP